MTGGTLFVSRNTNIFLWLKGAFDEAGFRNVSVTPFDKDALVFRINELKPQRIFIESTFYTGVTPYMIGELLVKFPHLKMHIVNFSDFPDSLAVRFIFHGAKSYLDFRDGPDEFLAGLEKIKAGEDYYSPGVDRHINELKEIPNLTKLVTDREWQVLFLICNGFSRENAALNLAISERTFDTHKEHLHILLDVKRVEDLIRKAICLGWVKKEHLCFHCGNPEIPPSPARKSNNHTIKVERRIVS